MEKHVFKVAVQISTVRRNKNAFHRQRPIASVLMVMYSTTHPNVSTLTSVTASLVISMLDVKIHKETFLALVIPALRKAAFHAWTGMSVQLIITIRAWTVQNKKHPPIFLKI